MIANYSEELSQMSLEELWQLFPIELKEHNDAWNAWYEEEKNLLRTFLPEDARINHIGSTAIKGIWAKPIVDILVEISGETDFGRLKDEFSKYGYICMSENRSRISFNKGYTPRGFDRKVFHVHVVFFGDTPEIAFRDYLNANPKVAKEYETLKLGLWKKYEHDRDGYTDAKTDFIQSCLAKINAMNN